MCGGDPQARWETFNSASHRYPIEDHYVHYDSTSWEHIFTLGFQQPGIDYAKTFTPVARLDIVRIDLVVAAENKWLVYQMDVK